MSCDSCVAVNPKAGTVETVLFSVSVIAEVDDDEEAGGAVVVNTSTFAAVRHNRCSSNTVRNDSNKRTAVVDV
jgi:hypothetical protein